MRTDEGEAKDEPDSRGKRAQMTWVLAARRWRRLPDACGCCWLQERAPAESERRPLQIME